MIVISPSKRQADPIYEVGLDKPTSIDKTKKLIEVLSQMSEAELAGVLGVSPELAKKAYDNYQDLISLPDESVKAINLYQGDVFKSLDAKSLSDKEHLYLEKHLRIISPLYGLITPQCGIWPYRLEMVSKVPGFDNLSQYWQEMQKAVELERPEYIFNLASKEYASCIHAPEGTKWVDIVFEDKGKDGKYRVIAVKAKRMRGELLRYMAQNNVERPDQLYHFEHKDYEFSEEVSKPLQVVFRAR